MNSKRLSIIFLPALLLVFLVVGCAPHLGATIETPEVPVTQIKSDARARLGTYVALQGIEDGRRLGLSEEPTEYTQPAGAVRETVEAAIRDAFREHGISILDTAPVQMKTTVREWKSQVSASTTSSIDSKAVLYVELFDPTGKRMYSGTYEGTRSSQFPVINRTDVKDSLGLAMANCIGHIIDDPKIMEMIASY